MSPILPTPSQLILALIQSHRQPRWSVTLCSFAIGLGLVACSSQFQVPKAVNIKPIVTPRTINAEVYAQPAVRFGVLLDDSAISVHERYRPLLDYLERRTSRRFELITLSQASQFEAVQQQQLDFITNNPLAAVQLRRLYDIEFLVTTRRPEVGTQLGGLIIVRADSGIETIEDLKGKQAVCVNFQTAAEGCVLQIDYLQKQGFDPFSNFSRFVENKSQDNIVLAVMNGSVDVGFIRTGQLEKMLKSQMLNSLDPVSIFQSVEDKFPLAHTTGLYPEWPIAALAETDPELVAEVRQVLLEITPNHPAIEIANFSGFVPAVDYTSIEALIEPLKLKSWDAGDRTDVP